MRYSIAPILHPCGGWRLAVLGCGVCQLITVTGVEIDFGFAAWPAEQVSLHSADACQLEQAELLHRLDALRGRRNAQAMCERHGGGYDCGALGAPGHVVDESPVNLDTVDRKHRQLAER